MDVLRSKSKQPQSGRNSGRIFFAVHGCGRIPSKMQVREAIMETRRIIMTVCGGLELGLALIFLLAVPKPQTVNNGLLACMLVHGSLCVFRTISFFHLSDIGPMTYKLAIGEWVIFLMGSLIWYFNRKSTL